MRLRILILLLCALALPLPAQTFTVLTGFNGADGARPGFESLVQGTDGNLYGTTTLGGANNLGLIFKITTDGVLTALHSFAGSDGSDPNASLVMAADSNFYGTTYGAKGHGTIFRMTPDGTLTTLHAFGELSYSSGLIQAADGDLYGTTVYGGGSASCLYGCGTFFKITTKGDFTLLHIFTGGDGSAPVSGVIQAGDGNFYGTTSQGGANGYGTAFRITSAGEVTTLYGFCAQTPPYCYDGADPSGGLIQAIDANFYGTTASGGSDGFGSIFKLTAEGVLTTLHDPLWPAGVNPGAGLVQATNGDFYGTAAKGGGGDGTIFQVTYGGALTVEYTFNYIDGAKPSGGLVQATDGNFYGTTSTGGADGLDVGTVFKLSLGLGPFVKTVPAAAKAGAVIRILGTDLTGATSVTFNGDAANFELQFPTEITATVPHGASTGKIQVTTPSGTLPSNVAFRVTK